MGRFLLVILLNLLVMQKPLFAREILGNTCKIALAVAKSNPVSGWVLQKIKNKILVRTFPFPDFKPEITTQMSKDADKNARDLLDKLGISYKKVEGSTDARKLTMRSLISANYSALDEMSLYEFKLMNKPAGRRHPFTKALEHPDFPEVLKELETKGYKVLIDSSLGLTGAGGIVNNENKTMVINANLDWVRFQHEMRHIEYEEAKTLGLFDIDRNENLEAFPNFKDLVARAKQLKLRGFNDISVHETLATEREVELLKQSGFKAWNPEIKRRIEYSRSYQIGDILGVKPENRTPEQLARLTKALIEFEAGMDMETSSFWSTLSPTKKVAILGTITVLGSAGLTLWYLSRNNSSSSEESDEEKDIYIQTQDGEWILVK